ncbi:MAG: carboxypeptidase-like regulatory domain-containing protein [Hymenobacter sp.]
MLVTLLGINGSACTKGDLAVNGPRSTYHGSVQLMDEFGKPVADKGGVAVSVVDHATLNTSTDASGSFQLELPLGAQRLAFAKTGYGTCQTPTLTITASPATAPKAVTLGRLSTTAVIFFRSWELIDYDWYRYMGRLNEPSTPAPAPVPPVVFLDQQGRVAH